MNVAVPSSDERNGGPSTPRTPRHGVDVGGRRRHFSSTPQRASCPSRMIHSGDSLAAPEEDEGSPPCLVCDNTKREAEEKNWRNIHAVTTHGTGRMIDGVFFHGDRHCNKVYIVKKWLGKGTFGAVYACTNRLDGGDCAVKEIDIEDGIMADGRLSPRLEQQIKEVEILSSLARHENIVYYSTSFLQLQAKQPKNPLLYVQMEEMKMTLSEFLAGKDNLRLYDIETNRVDEPQISRLFFGVISGLNFMHNRSVAHLDIKPANILLDGNGVPKISDFGLSRPLFNGVATDVGGTKLYASPEQRARQPCDAKSDMYSAAFVLAELLDPTLQFKTMEDIEKSFDGLRRGIMQGSLVLCVSSVSFFVCLLQSMLEECPWRHLSSSEVLRDLNSFLEYDARGARNMVYEVVSYSRHLIYEVTSLIKIVAPTASENVKRIELCEESCTLEIVFFSFPQADAVLGRVNYAMLARFEGTLSLVS